MQRIRLSAFLLSFIVFLLAVSGVSAQGLQKEIKLPNAINGKAQEYSGLATWNNRVYLLPQYGNNKNKQLNGSFSIYSIRLDSIAQVINGTAQAITSYRDIRVENLDQLADAVVGYQGFEAFTIVKGKVFLSIETEDTLTDYCYIVTGTLDTTRNLLTIDPKKLLPIKRFSFIPNAGFESLAYLPKEKKLLAIYEFNGYPYGSKAYTVDTSLTSSPTPVDIPRIDFRLTDIFATTSQSIYALNYHWNGDYESYLNNCIVHADPGVLRNIPELKDSAFNYKSYLKNTNTCITRIVKLKSLKDRQWQPVKFLEKTCTSNNWEGLVPYKKGFLMISDANGKDYLNTTLLYVE